MTDKQHKIIAELEAATTAVGLEAQLQAARDLARAGIDPVTIEGMMRWFFSRAQIGALCAEAQAANIEQAKQIPVIS